MKLPIFLFFTFLFLVLFSCRKEIIEPDDNFEEINLESSDPSDHPQNIFISSDKIASSRNQSELTILGEKRQNPFTVEIMTEAWNNLKGENISTFLPNKLYVKFIPNKFEDYEILEKTDEVFYDFPLENEVLSMGKYYIQPGTTKESFPVLYSIVEPDFQFPNVNYEIISELLVTPFGSRLTKEAFKITGNIYEFNSNDGTGVYAMPFDCSPECANWPECLEPDIICEEGEEPPCDENHPFYPNCLDTPDSPFVINDCGCQVYNNVKKPGGCVKVEDTQFSTPGSFNTYLPVRRVKVIMKDKWFTEDETWTDDNGCWKINKLYNKNAWMWIKFKNDRCKIRMPELGAGTLSYLNAVKHYVGNVGNGVFNNISVNYNMWTIQGHNAQRYWGAATVNNTLHEFHDEAASDNIYPPDDDLNIFLTQESSYALMTKKIGPTETAEAVVSGLVIGNHWLLDPFFILGYPVEVIAIHFFPDVAIDVNKLSSDRVKSTAFHEFAHTSHFQKVGPIYWLDLVTAEVAANGHGNSSSLGAELIAICESWGDFISLRYTHRQYPLASQTSIGGTYLNRLERTWNESSFHVPIGLHQDLIDIGEPVLSCNTDGSGCVAVTDGVSGFTISQLFTCLSPDAYTLQVYQDNIVSTFLGSTSNSAASVNSLFGQYGY